MDRKTSVSRKTKETEIFIRFDIDGSGKANISTGIPFFDHMLTAFAVHGFFDLEIKATGDIDVDFHHTIEDVGLVLGQALAKTLEIKNRIVRFGANSVPMDEALSSVSIDLSKRPFLVYNVQPVAGKGSNFDIPLAKEFFRAFANTAGMNLHINLLYGENEHHIIESIFKATGRALDQAVTGDDRISDVRSTKGTF